MPAIFRLLDRHIIVLLCVFSCQNATESKVILIDAQELKELRKENIQLIDVRTPREFEVGRIKGATLINFLSDDFTQLIEELDKEKPLIVYCGIGGRSKKASEIMIQKGFKTIYDYSGGFKDWESRGERVER